MASITGSAVTFSCSFKLNQASARVSSLKSVPFPVNGKAFPSFKLQPAQRLQVSCMAAKPETLEKVCGIARKQLALSADTEITGNSKFSSLGADSLDTVEIVMGLRKNLESVLRKKVPRPLRLIKMQLTSLRTSSNRTKIIIICRVFSWGALFSALFSKSFVQVFTLMCNLSFRCACYNELGWFLCFVT